MMHVAPLLAAAVLALAAPSARAAARARASSVLEDEQGVKHDPELAFDGLLSTGWGEGEEGSGEGSWIELDLGRPTEFHSISIWPGNLSEGKKSYREYSRPRLIQVTLDGKPLGDPVRLQDEVQRLDLPLSGKGRRLRIEVLESFEGFVFQDLFISEVCLDYAERYGRQDDRLQEWLDSMGGEAAREAYEQEVKEKFAAHKHAEFGDPEALHWLMDAVGDGAPFIREQVRRLVPLGYRAAYIHPDELALSALRKLKDPNSIPAIEMASLRAVGDEKAELSELVEIFYAYQELIGGPDPNVPYWGKTGWAQGAIQSFGEPVPVVVDSEGRVYVADIGNNRVQRFAPDGRPERVWGGEPDITDAWFDRGRPWYVSGSRPGTGKGEFVNPLDVELLPGKEGDGFAVLDAKGRIQLFDPEGNVLIGWTLRSDNRVEPALGGEAYLAYLPKKKLVYAFWGDEAIGFDLQGQEVDRFEIQDGTPNAVVVDRRGHFLLCYRGDVLRYDVGGFRYGKVMDRSVLGEGFEDVDLAVDEDGRLWALTDTAWATKFKKPGKVDYRVKVADYSFIHPRFAVRDDMLFISDRDHILRVDALQLKLDQEQAEEEAGD